MSTQTKPFSLSLDAEFDSLDHAIAFLKSADGSINNFELKFDDEVIAQVQKERVPYVHWVDVSAPTVKISHQAIDIPSNFFDVCLPTAAELSSIVDAVIERDSELQVVKCGKFFRDAMAGDIIVRVHGVDTFYVFGPEEYKYFCETGAVPLRL